VSIELIQINAPGTELPGFVHVNLQGSADMRNSNILPRTPAKSAAKPLAKPLATAATDNLPPGQPAGGLLAQQHITILLVGIGLRCTRSASAYYRAAFDLGMAEWRLLMALRSTEALNVGELSAAADLDKAAVSRSLVLLGERKLVSVTQTRTRGRAAIAELTPEGKKLSTRLMQVSLQRQDRLFKNFTRTDKERLHVLLDRLAQELTKADWDQ
jgi:DNA-binding MarR family transcriptional regulator